MVYADEQSYEEVISALNRFKKTMVEECDVMKRAGEDCVDNMGKDPAALGSCKKLAECTTAINMNLELIDVVITEMRAQIQRIKENADKASRY